MLPIQSVWSKLEIDLLLSNFLQSSLNILDFVAGLFKKKSLKKTNCGRWSENVDITLPDSISSKEVEFEKMLSIKGYLCYKTIFWNKVALDL